MIEFLEEQKMVSVSFDDLDVLSDQDKETFVLNLNFFEEQMPFYIKVQDYNFSFSGQSFLINGRSAMLPDLIEENVYIDLGTEQAKEYSDLYNTRLSIDGKDSAGLLALITELKKLANFSEKTRKSAKLDYLKDLLKELMVLTWLLA